MEIELTPTQIAWIVAVILILTALIILVKIVKRFVRRAALDEDIKEGWKKIENLMAGRDEEKFKLAILEADKLLDSALKMKGFAGKSLGERLKIASYKFERLRKVWPAHKLRNRLVHEADFKIDYNKARWAIKQYKECLELLAWTI